jgi:hypothetical protein
MNERFVPPLWIVWLPLDRVGAEPQPALAARVVTSAAGAGASGAAFAAVATSDPTTATTIAPIKVVRRRGWCRCLRSDRSRIQGCRIVVAPYVVIENFLTVTAPPRAAVA